MVLPKDGSSTPNELSVSVFSLARPVQQMQIPSKIGKKKKKKQQKKAFFSLTNYVTCSDERVLKSVSPLTFETLEQ